MLMLSIRHTGALHEPWYPSMPSAKIFSESASWKWLQLKCFPEPDDLIRLWPLRALDDVELYGVAFFQALIAVKLDRAVMHEDIRAILTAKKAITLCVVEPLHLSFVLCHVLIS